MQFHLAEKLPRAAALVALPDGAAVDRDGRRAEPERAVENLVEVVAALWAVVHAAAHFHGHRHVRRQGLANSGDDLQRGGRIAHQISAPATPQHLFHRAGEVQIEHVEAGGDEFQGGGRELLGHGPHQLRPAGMLVVAHPQKTLRLVPFGHIDHELIEQHLAEREGRAQPPGDRPHRPIAVAAQRRLHYREVDGNRAETELRQR